MNAAAASNGPDNGSGNDFKAERARLFAEIATLKEQRNELQRQLAECRRENRELRAQLEGSDG